MPKEVLVDTMSSAAFLVFLILTGVLVETLGNGLLYGIFLYEKYGVDSMRRTIVNMLYSQLCLTYIFSNILAFPIAISGFCLHEFNGEYIKVI